MIHVIVTNSTELISLPYKPVKEGLSCRYLFPRNFKVGSIANLELSTLVVGFPFLFTCW